jgi:hypothetical protein
MSKPPFRDGNVLRQQAGEAVGLGLLAVELGSCPGVDSLERPRQTNLEEIICWEASLPGCEILYKLKKNIFSELFRDNSSNSNPSRPLLKGANGKQIPSWGFITKTVKFEGKVFTWSLLQTAVAGPILGIDFLRKFKITVAPETSQILFACTAASQPAKSFFPTFAQLPAAPSLRITFSHTIGLRVSGEDVQFWK